MSCLFVVVSTLCLIFSTLPAFQVKDHEGKISRKFIKKFIYNFIWSLETLFCCSFKSLQTFSQFWFDTWVPGRWQTFYISEEEYFFEVAEAVFVGWFSFEYVIRFVAAPQKSAWVLWDVLWKKFLGLRFWEKCSPDNVTGFVTSFRVIINHYRGDKIMIGLL